MSDIEVDVVREHGKSKTKIEVIEDGDAEEEGVRHFEIPDEDSDEDLDTEDGGFKKVDKNKWHNFESQYSLVIQKSVQQDRGQWSNQIEFLMSCIASSVGLGNIWRFPFVAGANGGGAFLIPYFLVILIIARPMFFLELSWGQFCSGGPVTAWEMAPLFRGVAISQTIVSFLTASFYMVIMSWTLLYFVYSFNNPLPWKENPGKFFGVDHLKEDLKDFEAGRGLGCPPDWKLLLSLLTAWFMVWLVMVRGVSGSGKIAYFTALFPYVILLILLVRGALLDGAGDGIIYFLNPQPEKLLLAQTWFQAISQCFFSLGISFGGLVVFSSFNKFKHNLGRDVLIVSIMDTFTSMLAGITIFGILGNLANVEYVKNNLADYKFNSTDKNTGRNSVTNFSGKYSLKKALVHIMSYGTSATFDGTGTLTPDQNNMSMWNGIIFTDIKNIAGKIGNFSGKAFFNGTANVTIVAGNLSMTGYALINGNGFNDKNGNLLIRLNGTYGTNIHSDTFEKRLEKLAAGGAGLAFVAYPQALQQFGAYPLPQVFSVLFFFMILVLAIGSANGLVGNVVTVLCDSHPKVKRWKVLTVVCLMGFFGGIVYTTPAGGEIIDLVDKQGSEFCLFILAFVEIVGIAWVYGLKNIVNDIEFMLDKKLNIYWPICWGILIPFLLVGIFGFYVTTLKINPKWHALATIFGWLLSIFVIGVVPLTGVYVVMTRKSRFFKKKFLASIHPTRKWGPIDEVMREAWRRNRLQLPDEYICTTRVKAMFRRCLNLPPVPPRVLQVDPYAYDADNEPSQTASVLATKSMEIGDQLENDGQNPEEPGVPGPGSNDDQKSNP